MGLNLSSFSKISSIASTASTVAKGFINKASSLIGSNTTGNVRTRFLAPSGINGQGAINSNFDDRYDQITYLTFTIHFVASNSVNDLKYNSLQENSLTTNTYDDIPQALFQTRASSSSTNYVDNYSAVNYLEDRGENLRAAMLEEFITDWNSLQNDYQFYFQEISGLNSLLELDPAAGMRIKEGKIRIKCLEGIDLKVKHLLQMYRKIAWDDEYQRWVLPDIYRFFKVNICISEIRQFHESNYTRIAREGGSAPKEGMVLEVINNVMPAILIKGSMCEFVIGSWLNDAYSVSNDQPEETSFEITIKQAKLYDEFPMKGWMEFLSDDFDRIVRIRNSADDSGFKIYNSSLNGKTDVSGNLYEYATGADQLADDDRKHILDASYRHRYANTWLSNLISWGKGYVSNYVENKIDWYKTKNLVGNLSISGVISALESKDLITVFGAIGLALQKSGRIPASAATSQSEIPNSQVLTEVIRGISLSKATSAEEQKLIDAAKEMLEEPYKIEISSAMPEEELLAKLANYQLKKQYEDLTGNDRSWATDLDGGPDGSLLYNSNDEVPSRLLDGSLNKFLDGSIDRSRATDLDGGPDKSNIIYGVFKEVPSERLDGSLERFYQDVSDRSMATDLDGGPDKSGLLGQISDAKPSERLDGSLEKFYLDASDRSIATDLDGGPDKSGLTWMKSDKAPSEDLNKTTQMDSIPSSSDRSLATDLDGSLEMAMTSLEDSSYNSSMAMTSLADSSDRSIATDLDGGPNKTRLTPNKTSTKPSELLSSEVPAYDALDASFSPATSSDNTIPREYDSSNIDRSIATDLDGGPSKDGLIWLDSSVKKTSKSLENEYTKTSGGYSSNGLTENKEKRVEADLKPTLAYNNVTEISIPLSQSLTSNRQEISQKLSPSIKKEYDASEISDTLHKIFGSSISKEIEDNNVKTAYQMTKNKESKPAKKEEKLVKIPQKSEKTSMDLVYNTYDGPVSMATAPNTLSKEQSKK